MTDGETHTQTGGGRPQRWPVRPVAPRLWHRTIHPLAT